MQNKKKVLSEFLFILLFSMLLSVLNTGEVALSNEDQLTTDLEIDWNPCGTQILQAANETIWVVWASNRTENLDIFYKNSSDGGATWSAHQPLTTYQYKDDSPSIMQTANGSIWVMWARDIMTPEFNRDIFYKTSSDGGATWSNDTRLTNDTHYDMAPSITQTANGTIWVVWQSTRIWVWDPQAGEEIPQDDIYYKTSSDDGATWSNDTRLTTDLNDDVGPSIIQTSNGTIWVTWSSDRQGNDFDIFYKTSSDGGTAWSNESRLTTHGDNDWAPSITETINGTIWVVWHSYRNSNYDIYYKTSEDGGVQWSTDKRLTTDSDYDVTPSITQTADGKIWIFWTSNRAGNYDIWYTTTIHDGPPPSADVNCDGVVDVTDFVVFVGRHGCSVGDQGYDPNADFDNDGDIDGDDWATFFTLYS